MPAKSITFGPFSGVFVGPAPPGSGPLTQITAKRTEGGFLSYILPELWVNSFGNSIPNGEAELQFDITFYGAGEQAMRLAMGNPLTTASQDDTPQFAKYTMLLTVPEENEPESILIPVCYSLKQLRLNREKKTPTKIKVTFLWRDRNPHIKLYKKDTVANLLLEPEMTGRSPF